MTDLDRLRRLAEIFARIGLWRLADRLIDISKDGKQEG